MRNLFGPAILVASALAYLGVFMYAHAQPLPGSNDPAVLQQRMKAPPRAAAPPTVDFQSIVDKSVADASRSASSLALIAQQLMQEAVAKEGEINKLRADNENLAQQISALQKELGDLKEKAAEKAKAENPIVPGK